MTDTTTKIAPKKAASKPATKAAIAAQPVAATKSAAAVKPAATAKPLEPLAATAVAKPVEKKPAAVKAPAAKSPDKTILISDEQRYRMIAEAAYYRAESKQFQNDPLRNWIDAESDIIALLNGSN